MANLRSRLPTFALAVAALAWPVAAARAEAAGRAQILAVFPVDLADTSGEAPKPGRAEQVTAATADLAEFLEASGRYRAVDLAPLRDDLAASGPLHRCEGCWIDMARRVGAEVAAVTVVHKVSTLVSSMHVWLVDVQARRVIRSGAVSLRGDTDEAWRRAAGYLARNVLLNESPDHPSLSSPFPGG